MKHTIATAFLIAILPLSMATCSPFKSGNPTSSPSSSSASSQEPTSTPTQASPSASSPSKSSQTKEGNLRHSRRQDQCYFLKPQR